MKTGKLVVLGAAIAFMSASQSGADLYGDAVGDLGAGVGSFPHIDIVSVVVANNATDLTLTINLDGDPIATNWGKYLVGIDSVAGGDTAGNGWARPLSMSSGMDYFIGSWVDSGNGAEVYSWTGAAWVLSDGAYAADSTDILNPVTTSSSVTLTTSLASLGLGMGDSFVFDVWTSGGGGSDSAVDALSDPNPSIDNWGESYDSTSSLTYTVIPEPATMGLISIFGLGLLAGRRIFRLRP